MKPRTAHLRRTHSGPRWTSDAPGVWRLLSARGEALGPICVRDQPGAWVWSCDGCAWQGEGSDVPLDLAMQAAQGLPTDTRPQENG